jgi:hypothetical protein
MIAQRRVIGRHPIPFVTIGVGQAERSRGDNSRGISHTTRRFRIELMRSDNPLDAAGVD